MKTVHRPSRTPAARTAARTAGVISVRPRRVLTARTSLRCRISAQTTTQDRARRSPRGTHSRAAAIASAARAQSCSLTSRWVTSRRVRPSIAMVRTPSAARAAATSGAVRPSRVATTMFVWGGVDLDTAPARQGLGQAPGVGVVLGEARDGLVEGHETGGSQDPGLAHAASEELSYPPGLLDPLARRGHERAHRTSEAFRQAGHHRVGAGHESGGRDPERHGRVPDAGAVDVEAEPRRAGGGDHGLGLGATLYRAASQVVRVLEHHEADVGLVVGAGGHGLSHVLGPEVPVGGVHHPWHDPVEHAHRRQLVADDVAPALDEDLVPPLGEDADGDGVAHRARTARRARPRSQGPRPPGPRAA